MMITEAKSPHSLKELLEKLIEIREISDNNSVINEIHYTLSKGHKFEDYYQLILQFEERILTELNQKLFYRVAQISAPGIFARCNIASRHPQLWGSSANIFLSQAKKEQGHKKLILLMTAAAHQAMATYPEKALSFFIKLLFESDLQNTTSDHALQFGLLLSNISWILPNNLDFRTDLLDLFSQHGHNPARCEYWIMILILLGFNRKFAKYGDSITREFMEFLFHNITLPLLDVAIKNHLHRCIFYIEALIFSCYSKIKDTSEHYQHIKFQTTPRLLRYARSMRKNMPNCDREIPNKDTHKVLFFLYNTSYLAHSRFILNYFKGVRKLSSSPIIPYVACHSFIESELTQHLKDLDIELYAPKHQDINSIFELRSWCQRNEISAIVYVSNTTAMPIYFGLETAPVQIYLSLKYHVEIFREIDGYLTSGSFQKFRQIQGHTWRTGHAAIQNLFDASQTASAQQTRATLSQQGRYLLLGSFGREVKYNNDDFVATLAKILDQIPEARYLWTGRFKSPEIIDRFTRFGIADRCDYIGWVNTAHFAQVIDLYVDTFPFASGHTAMEAMAAGCPVILLATQEALNSSIATHVLPTYRGEVGNSEQQQQIRTIFTDTDGTSLLPMVDNIDEYIDWTVRLAKNPELRSRAGAAARRFVEETLGDVEQMARDYNQHILEIIEEQREHRKSLPS